MFHTLQRNEFYISPKGYMNFCDCLNLEKILMGKKREVI